MSCIKRISTFFDKVCRVLVQMLTALMFVVILLQVFFRYFLHAPLSWSEELARFTMNWITFIGVSAACKADSLSRVDIVTQKLSHKTQKALFVIADLIMLVITVMLFYYSIQFCTSPSSLTGMSPGLHIPNWLIYSCLPIGFFLLVLQLAFRLVLIAPEKEKCKEDETI